MLAVEIVPSPDSRPSLIEARLAAPHGMQAHVLEFGAERTLWIAVCWLVIQFTGACIAGIAAAFVATAVTGSPRTATLSPAAIMVVATLGNVAATAVGFRMVRKSFDTFREGARTVGYRATRARVLVLAAIIGLSIAVFNLKVLIGWFPPSSAQDLGPLVAAMQDQSSWQRVWVGCMVVVAPIVEESMFRGVLFTGLARSWGVSIAAGITTLAFALLHISSLSPYWPAILGVLLLGAAAQAARIATRSLWPCMMLHFAYNLTVVGSAYVKDV
jgi:membrane protease YdiL (CAAX protease family)